jgi:hypothetical protein
MKLRPPLRPAAARRIETNVDMKTTFSRMKDARAVLNVSHVNDEIHNRTLNGLNAGCANIIEDNAVHRRLFKHCENALFFRYDDDSLRQCLDLVCTDPSRAYEVGEGASGCVTTSRSGSAGSTTSSSSRRRRCRRAASLPGRMVLDRRGRHRWPMLPSPAALQDDQRR